MVCGGLYCLHLRWLSLHEGLWFVGFRWLGLDKEVTSVGLNPLIPQLTQNNINFRPDCNMFYLPHEQHAPQAPISMLIL